VAGARIYSAFSTDLLQWDQDLGHRLGTEDRSDTAYTARHPHAMVEPDGSDLMLFWRHVEVWSARSEEGLQWDWITSTGVAGADPHFVKLPVDTQRMYAGGCGKDDQQKIISAQLVRTTWGCRSRVGKDRAWHRLPRAPCGDFGRIQQPRFTGDPHFIAVTDPGREHPHISHGSPFKTVFRVPNEKLQGQILLLVASDGAVTREIKLSL
jgi:hypothetical protein